MILKKETIDILDLKNNIEYTFNGLSLEQVQVVKEKAKEKSREQILIGNPFYFAVWMFFGVLITMFVRGSIFGFLLKL
jgi:hypothetical protein